MSTPSLETTCFLVENAAGIRIKPNGDPDGLAQIGDRVAEPGEDLNRSAEGRFGLAQGAQEETQLVEGVGGGGLQGHELLADLRGVARVRGDQPFVIMESFAVGKV